jgi:hypothetical protein
VHQRGADQSDGGCDRHRPVPLQAGSHALLSIPDVDGDPAMMPPPLIPDRMRRYLPRTEGNERPGPDGFERLAAVG